jgi:MinD-like ATPase involved in chromosome partitioning or flagellar assembly
VTLPVVVAIPGPDEARLLAAWEPLRREVVVVRRCADITDVLAVTGAGLARAVVLGADLTGCDTETVETLRRNGVGVLVLLPAGADGERLERRWRSLGVTRFAAVDRPPGDLAREVALSVTSPVTEDRELLEEAPATPEPASNLARGRLVAVWGPHGSTGRTTVAVNLAAELAASEESVLLVDADTRGASVGQFLGLLDEAPGLLAAVRAAADGRLDTAALSRHTPVVAPGLSVLPGASDPGRWSEVRPAAFRRVLDVAGASHDWTVVDLPGGLDGTDDGGRDLVTRVVLEAADLVLVVGTGDPVGLQRLARTWADLPDAVADALVLPVVNRVRPASLGAAPTRATNALLRRVAGIEDAVLLLHDDAVDAALLAGRTLAEHLPRSAVRRSLAGLAQHVEQLVDAPDAASEGSPSSGFDPLLARS